MNELLQRLVCWVGRHDLKIVRAVSDQSAQVECVHCKRQWARKMIGECEGSMIPWESAKFFYTEERIQRVLGDK